MRQPRPQPPKRSSSFVALSLSSSSLSIRAVRAAASALLFARGGGDVTSLGEGGRLCSGSTCCKWPSGLSLRIKTAPRGDSGASIECTLCGIAAAGAPSSWAADSTDWTGCVWGESFRTPGEGREWPSAAAAETPRRGGVTGGGRWSAGGLGGGEGKK